MGEFSISHLLILAVILLIFFGPNKLPQFGQSVGKAIRGFKQGLNEIDADSKDVTPKSSQQIAQQQNNSDVSNNAQKETTGINKT